MKKGYQLNPEFKELWKRVAKRTKFAVNIDTSELIKQCIEENIFDLSEIIIRLVKTKKLIGYEIDERFYEIKGKKEVD